MSLKKNILANYLGTAVTALAPMLALPYYLQSLGITVWGLVGFIAMLNTVLSLLDAGLSQALIKEFAAANEVNQVKKYKLGTLLFGFECVYWGFAFFAGAILFVFSHQIVHGWLELKNVSLSQAQLAIYGAAAIIIFQLPGSIYRSLLAGTQSQVLLNKILISGSLFRHIGGVLLVLKSPTLETYLIWQVFSVGLETLVRSFFSWRTLTVKRSESHWDSVLMKQMFAPTAGMSIATLLGAITVQMDKIILSGMISIEMFGYYVIASTLSLGVLQILYPVVTATIPHALNLSKKPSELQRFNFKYAKVVILIIIASGSVFYFIGYEFLLWWLKSVDVAKQVYPLLCVLLVGSALNALYTIGYINWVVKGKPFKIMQVNVISFLLSVALIPILVTKLGAIGASISWLIINSVGLLLSADWLKSHSKRSRLFKQNHLISADKSK